MFGGVLHKGEPDEEWSVLDEYRSEMLAVRGIKSEFIVENVIEFDRVAADNNLDKKIADKIREQILETQQLGLPVRVRLVPAYG